MQVNMQKQPPVSRAAADSVVMRRQAPLRTAYKESPQRALVVKRVITVADAQSDALHGSVVLPYEGSRWRFGVDRAVGGLHDVPNPGEMLCAALAACAEASIRMLADMLGITLQLLEVEVIGHVDVRGCLGIDRAVPVGFQTIVCHVRIGAAMGTPTEAVAMLLARAERACVNLATLRSGVAVEVRHEIRSAPGVAVRSAV